MGWSGGTYTQTDGVNSGDGICAAQAADGDAKIKAAYLDALFEDNADGINACLNKDGSNAATGDLDLGGSYHLTNMANGSATGDSGTWDKDVASLSLDGLTLECNFNNSTKATVDLTSVNSGTAGVTLTGSQTISGQKNFTTISEHAHIKNNGPYTNAVQVVTSSTTPTIDTTAGGSHYIVASQNQTWDFTWPTAATDSELGANWEVKGSILVRMTGNYTVTLKSTMLSALDYYEEEGSAATGSGNLSTLTYHYLYIGGTKICQFAWIATTA